MTDELSIGLTKLLRKARMADDVDFLREGMRAFSEAVMELEVTQHVGAERHAHRDTHGAAQWLSGTALGHAGRHD
jgi:transposase-like protein